MGDGGVEIPPSPGMAGEEGSASVKKSAREYGSSPARSRTNTVERKHAEAPPAAAKAKAEVVSGQFALDDLVAENWCHLLELLGLAGIVYNIASHCELSKRAESSLEFVLDDTHAALFNDSHNDKLRMALENYFGHAMAVVIAPGQCRGETPAMRQQRLAAERQAEAVLAIEGDSQLQALIARFDGELDHSSILPTDI